MKIPMVNMSLLLEDGDKERYCQTSRRPVVLSQTGRWLFILGWLAVFAMACGAPVASSPLVPDPTTSLANVAGRLPSDVSSSPLHSLEGALEGTYYEVNPSVVNIRVVQKQEISYPELHGIPFPGLPSDQGSQEQYRTGLGSGFVLDSEGHIVTNYHVVAGADTIRVTFYDETAAVGEVVGTDPDSDLAVIKVDMPANKLHPVEMGNSDQVKVGQLAIAIGNPFGLQSTMTVGVVSAVGRSLPVDSGDGSGASYSIPEIIQTDAPINPGNSGGVLLDASGKLIGVTSAIISPVQASAGIGFAIPSAIVQKVVPALIDTGHYDHPWLGATLTSLNPDLAGAMDLDPGQQGALVMDITPDSPAFKSGLHGSSQEASLEGQQVQVGGDVIVAIDTQEVKRAEDLIDYLERNARPDQKVSVTILRSGEERTLTVTLAKRPSASSADNQPVGEVADQAWLGFLGLTLSPDISRQMDLPAEQKGILVEQVTKGGPANLAGIQGSYDAVFVNETPVLVGGDVIIQVDDQLVPSVEDLQTWLSSARPGQEVTVTLLRNGAEKNVKVVLGTRPSYYLSP